MTYDGDDATWGGGGSKSYLFLVKDIIKGTRHQLQTSIDDQP